MKYDILLRSTSLKLFLYKFCIGSDSLFGYNKKFDISEPLKRLHITNFVNT
jgi:hypothetical protein